MQKVLLDVREGSMCWPAMTKQKAEAHMTKTGDNLDNEAWLPIENTIICLTVIPSASKMTEWDKFVHINNSSKRKNPWFKWKKKKKKVPNLCVCKRRFSV